MRKFACIGLVALLALCLVSTALAGEGKGEGKMKPHMKVSGEVVSVDAATRTITVREKKGDQNNDWTFVVAEDASVMVSGNKDSLDHLKAGDLVNVRYHDDGSTHTAVEVDGHPAAVPK